MGLPKKLTEQQIKFANILIAEEGRKTATQCAIEAGYAKDSARQAASKLQNPKLYPLSSAIHWRAKSRMAKEI
jgi:hypothetical protein